MEEVQGQRESGPRDRPGTDRYALQLRVCRSGLGSKCRLERCWLGERGLLRRIEGTPTFAGARAEGRTSAWGGRVGEAGEAQHLCWEPRPSGPRRGTGAGTLVRAWRRPGGACLRAARSTQLFPLPALRLLSTVLSTLLHLSFWPLPPRRIGFGNDPGWDREAVPWNPGGCRREAGWLVDEALESRPHCFLSWHSI